MIKHNSSDVQNKLDNFYFAAKDLGLFRALYAYGCRKAKGYPASFVFFCLLVQIFNFPNLFRRLQSSWSKVNLDCGKDVYYALLNCPNINWPGLVTKIAMTFIQKLRLEKTQRSCFIIDDTILERPRAKKVELCARTFDHVFGRHTKGFTLLLASWTDGRSTIPVGFSVLSSSNKKKRIAEAKKLDKRTHAAKWREDAVQQKPGMVLKLLKTLLGKGLNADYVLMDTWFTHEPVLLGVRKLGLHVVGMVKQLNQRYFIDGEKYTLNKLLGKARRTTMSRADIIGSILVHTKAGIPVKIVFIINRNNRKEYLTILSTDLDLSDNEVVELYGRRFSIEANFYNMKHFLHINKETQCRNFSSTVAYSALSMLRLLTLEWIKRGSEDLCTIGGLFYQTREDLLLVPFRDAFTKLMTLFKDIPSALVKAGLMPKENIGKAIELINAQLKEFYNASCQFIQSFFDLCKEDVFSQKEDLLEFENQRKFLKSNKPLS